MNNISGRILWNNASKYALLLAGVTILCTLAALPLEASGLVESSPVLSSVISFIIWAAKFAGSIFIMIWLMKKLVADYPEATNKDTARYGNFLSLASSILVAAFSYINLMYISPGKIDEAFNLMMTQNSAMLDSNSRSLIESIKDKMPLITLVVNFIYCYIYGAVLSMILSSNIPSRNPFDGDGTAGRSENSDIIEN